jgi:hypothetical protein
MAAWSLLFPHSSGSSKWRYHCGVTADTARVSGHGDSFQLALRLPSEAEDCLGVKPDAGAASLRQAEETVAGGDKMAAVQRQTDGGTQQNIALLM